jgi:RF-1 domain
LSADPTAALRRRLDWLALPPESFLKLCERTNFQASGPGGQKRNRVLSAVRLEHPPTGLRAEGKSRREVALNQSDALQKLRLQLALEAAALIANQAERDPAILRAQLPDTWPVFRAKINPDHPEFPNAAFLALAGLAAAEGDLAPAAQQLGISTSAFVRFLKLSGPVLQRARDLRGRFQRPPLL